MSDQPQPYRAPKPSRGGANETEPDYPPAAEPIVKVETNNFRQVLQHFNNDGALINAGTTRFSIPCAICQTRNLAINVQHEQLYDTSYEHYTVLMRCGHAFGYACLASWFFPPNSRDMNRRRAVCPMCRVPAYCRREHGVPLEVYGWAIDARIQRREIRRIRELLAHPICVFCPPFYQSPSSAPESARQTLLRMQREAVERRRAMQEPLAIENPLRYGLSTDSLAPWRSIDGVFEAAGQVPPSNVQNREGVSQNLDLEPRNQGLRRRTTIAGSEMTPPARLSLLDNSLGVMTQAVIMDSERGFQLVELDQPLLIQYMVTGARRPMGYPYVATRDEHGNYSWSEATSSDMANMSYRRYSY